jgi:hypothetical protein
MINLLDSHSFKQDFLSRLYQINWAALTHAYGSAEDVPEYVEMLLSDNEEIRTEAHYELAGNIHHQSTIYEATAFAVPFLIELLQRKDVKQRIEIFFLLGAIYQGVYRKTPTTDARLLIRQAHSIFKIYYEMLNGAEKNTLLEIFECEPEDVDDYDFITFLKK